MDINKLQGYTPGPWLKAGDNRVYADRKFATTPMQRDVVIADKGARTLSTDELNANASLIASAPTLLALAKLGLELAEAVEDSRHMVGDRETIWHEDHGDILDRAYALLNQAKEE